MTAVSGAPAAKAASATRYAISSVSPKMVGDAVMLIDVSVVIVTSVLAQIAYNYLLDEVYLDLSRTMGVGLLGGILMAAFLVRQGAYDLDNLIDLTGQIGKLLSSWVMSVLLLASIAFILKISEEFSRGWMILAFFLTPALLLVVRSGISAGLTNAMRHGQLQRRVAIVGAGPLSERLCTYIESRGTSLGLHVIGIFDDRRTRVRDKVAGVPVVGTVQDLMSLARTHHLDEIIIALPWSAEARVAALVEELGALPCDIRLCPDLVGLRFLDQPYSRIGSIGLLQVNSRPIKEWALIMKTALDYAIGAIGLLIAAPLMMGIAIAIKLESPGPVFFRQRRRGFNQNMFTVWKFRTMTVLEDGDVVRQATKGDDRITKVGRFLRRTSLDELPQLINVLLGSMSVVGPRPHAVAHDDYYVTLVSRYARRHRVKPGITGWAAVHGFRGETETLEKMAKRIEYDLYYMENWSLWLDFKILILTVFKGFWNTNAY
ncbi:MAG: undecaprenyl-phosphate glucose phosphotransferase [Alphaproteobacteria bacterium]